MSRDDIAIGTDGFPLPYGPAEVQKMVAKAWEEGEVIAVVMTVGGDLAVQVLGAPSEKLASALEETARAYRQALRGH